MIARRITPRRITPRRITPRVHTTSDPTVIARTQTEKLRRARLADCERAPLGWEKNCG